MRHTDAKTAGKVPEGEAIPFGSALSASPELLEWERPPGAQSAAQEDEFMAGLDLPEDLDWLEDDDGNGEAPLLLDGDDLMAGLDLPEDLDWLEDDDGNEEAPLLLDGDDLMAGLDLPEDLDWLEEDQDEDARSAGPVYVKARTFERVDLPVRKKSHADKRKSGGGHGDARKLAVAKPAEAPKAETPKMAPASQPQVKPFMVPPRPELPAVPPAPEGKAYGCLFVLTGKENLVADQLKKCCPEATPIIARQEKHKSDHGQKTRMETTLFPGYVFFEAPEAVEPYVSFPRENVIRVLTREDGSWHLMGEDEHFARWLFSYGGFLSFSKAYQEGDRIRILSGPLKDLEGSLRKIDRRGRSGQVDLNFNGRQMRVWLGFELVDTMKLSQEEKT